MQCGNQVKITLNLDILFEKRKTVFHLKLQKETHFHMSEKKRLFFSVLLPVFLVYLQLVLINTFLFPANTRFNWTCLQGSIQELELPRYAASKLKE